jgi:4-hydroxybenzoate polyprenyltransferase
MQRVKGLLKASHFGPTLLVTAISFGFATYYWWEGPAYVIAFGVFTGQLVVGWSNDLYDFEDDLKHNRQNKPLVSGVITREFLQRCLRLMVPFSFIANLGGPLGLNGGLVYMLGVAISKDITPPTWMWLGGALFGMAAHFINVIKDMKQDQISEIKGLPQRLGTRKSIVAAALLIALGLFVIFYS